MIAFNFEFYSPPTIEEAVELFNMTKSEGNIPMYYSGGTEFISRARRQEITADVVINLKEIKECQSLLVDEEELIIGSAVTLTTIIERNVFPLLSKVAQSIATRTARNKITIGGNMMSHLPYKEALLPFLLANSDLVIASEKGMQRVNIHDIYTNGLDIKDEEWIVQIITPKKVLNMPYYHEKRTRQSSVNYPLVTATSLFSKDDIRIALAGIFEQPIRSRDMETIAKDKSDNKETKVQEMMKQLPERVTDDEAASANYRDFILEGMLRNILSEREELHI